MNDWWNYLEHSGLGKERTQRIHCFIELFALELKHFFFRKCWQSHTGHVRHHCSSVVAHDINEIKGCLRAKKRKVL